MNSSTDACAGLHHVLLVGLRMTMFGRLPAAGLAILMLILAPGTACCAAAEGPPRQSERHRASTVETFRLMAPEDFLAGCDVRLTGVVTLVDTNRNILVLQDASGAVAFHTPLRGLDVQIGRSATIEGSDCVPYFAAWPDFPHRPAGWDICEAFEAPNDWSEYYLTRMRGYLRPPATGQYQFWIASDNSSELWLSSDSNPAQARAIASVARFGWSERREWSKFPSQRSEPIFLVAGQTYYIEAVQEQTTGGDHLAVAWSGPNIETGVIEEEYLLPWTNHIGRASPGSGILREYWTNFSLGTVLDVTGPRPYESALSLREARMEVHGPGHLPTAERVEIRQVLQPHQNFLWAQVEGMVRFVGSENGSGLLELSDGSAVVQVRARDWTGESAARLTNALVRIDGVCEAFKTTAGEFIPGVIWTSARDGIVAIETNLISEAVASRQSAVLISTNPAMQGFYGTAGVVTFNDRVLGNDYVFVQEDRAAVRIALERAAFQEQLKVGRWVELGGALDASKNPPVITPLVVAEQGIRSMPAPLSHPFRFPLDPSLNGRWAEVEGVVHGLRSDGMLSLVAPEGMFHVWIGRVGLRTLASYVDARIRARGVLLLNLSNSPAILTPSPIYVAVEQKAPLDPFALRRLPIGALAAAAANSNPSHRVRVVGEITYTNSRSFYVQDASGAAQVWMTPPEFAGIGESIEVVGFPEDSGSTLALTEALVRSSSDPVKIKIGLLNLSEGEPSKQKGMLVRATATVLGVKTNEAAQVLMLQQEQRVFSAALLNEHGWLPTFAPGSRVMVAGVCEDESAAAPATDSTQRPQMASAMNILMRTPRDALLLSGPPWWTWKRAAALVGALLAVLLVTLLWVHLLRRRLERQQRAQFAFSRQVLDGVENERRRIAANLHDSLGQTLLVIKNQAIMAGQLPMEVELQQRLEQISGATSNALEEIRHITHGLRPYQLDRLGLTQAIRALVGRTAETSSILFATRVEPIDGLFEKEAEINVYRIVQEAVANVVKHSNATEAAVVIRKRPSCVSLSIRDNGCGFDPSKPVSHPHDFGYGLSGIRERVRILRGNLTVDSKPGGGTILTVEVPLVREVGKL